MFKFGILSIGEGGSNFGECAAQKGIPVIALNTATIDLSKLKAIKSDLRIHLEGWEGAGRNREIGREAMITYADKIHEKAKNVFKDCDMVFVAGTTSGGTGSGGLPVGVEIVSDFIRNVGVITALPEINEGPKAYMNSLECFSELSQIENLGSVFNVDNEKAKIVFPNVDKTEIFRLSNNQVINNIFELGNLCDQTSYISNFDKNDYLGILSERGSSIVSKIVVPCDEVNNTEDVARVVQKSLENVCFSDLSDNQIVKAAVIGKIPKEKILLVDTKLIFKNIGFPYDIIEAYYPHGDTQNCIFYVALSGLSFPFDRLTNMQKSIEHIEKDLIEKVETSRNQQFETGNWTSKFKRKQVQKDKTSLAERLLKFK